jgi:hypothetical protein
MMRLRWLAPLAAAPIAQYALATQYLSVEQAQRAVFPAADAFVAQPLEPGAASRIGAPPGWSPKIWRVRAGARELGWFMVDQVIGKSELITYAVGVDRSGALLALEILDYREAHGGEIRLAGWRKQFAGKTAADAVELNRDIRNISGATLSCRHVTEGVQRLLRLQLAAQSP